MAAQELQVMDEMLQPLSAAMTPETAKVLSRLQATPSMQARVDELAARCNEGELTIDERAEYEMYVRIGNLFALIKAKAKSLLAETPNA
jgi:hypothetical protein